MAATNLFEAQLFLDDAGIAESARLSRVWHEAKKRCEPVLRGGEPWEGDLIVAYGSVLFHQGKFRIWYIAWNKPNVRVCYAESADGIHWVKPRLGLFEHGGNRDNNILFAIPDGFVDCLGVIADPADRQWPLKMIYWQLVSGLPEKCGLAAARSKDGIRWDPTPGLVLPGWGDRTNIMPAKDRGKYVIFGRYRPHLTECRARTVSRTESRDLIHWSEPELVCRPDPEDPPYLEIYSATAFRYESLYVGFLERMHMVPDVLDPEIWFSRDGRRWSRSRPRGTFIRRGPPDTWDCGWVAATCNAPIAHKGELMIHYSGRAHGHTYPPSYTMGAIGVASLRMDGFCSLRAVEKEGSLLTHPVRWPKAELCVNADPRRDIASHRGFGGGEVRVEAQTEQGKPIAGFAFDDCVPLTQNAISTVKWKDDRRLARLAGRTIRLAFRLRDAHLYSFKATDPIREG